MAKSITNELLLPLTNTGRKYGYIVWRKDQDRLVKAITGERDSIDLQIGDSLQRNKTIDWKQRRVGITYTLTRNLPKGINKIKLKKLNNRRLLVSFV